jgi:hypothetical protein
VRDLPRFSDSVTVAGSEGDSETLVVGSWNGESTISRSQDGERWQSEALPLSSASAIAAGPSGFVVMGGFTALYSAEGHDWTESSLPVARGNWPMAVTYGAATFVSVGLHGTIIVSPDAREWSEQSSGVSVGLLDVTFGPRAPR